MMSAIQELETQYSTGIYAKRDLTVVRGEGARLWDEDGKVYIDCIGGMGVASVGHANPKVAKAIAEQAQTLITCHELLYNDRRAQLLEKLAQVTPAGLDRFFLCNSGTEAIEGAIKFARMSTGKSGIVATMRGYHGRTLGSLSATWAPKSDEHFGPLPGGFQHVAYNKLDDLAEKIDDDTAAVLLEIVQGEGGVRPASAEYLQGVQQLCRERDVLLIVDEVQTGFGRTGAFFACEHYGLEPDIMTMAKAIAGGVPMGALAIGPRVQTIHKGTHSSTFGGNPLACAAACAVIDVMQEERLPERAAEVGAYFKEKLEAIDSKKVREVRGLGLLLGVELKTKVGPLLREFMQRGVLVAAAGTTVLRFLPPLVITTDDVDTVVDQVADVLQ
ncbi:aspartate aminotransferase family protein [Candidatus Entotheonella palauensis]|uniref:aspartate aminotransferase family protein n=1 Tax=Candidatus Entotheonella palauensis TaxID=93172 RepID=UPI00277B5873|nr:acetylornithine/succinylornithine family transaminase [Candidatus Entotheonella palauensis]